MNRHMYILADGGRITASDPSEFVRLLREGSWFDSGCTDKEYMVNFSNRYHELHGVTVRTDTPEHFMDDLKKYGYRPAPSTGRRRHPRGIQRGTR